MLRTSDSKNFYVELPENTRELVGDSTYFVINKSDLVPGLPMESPIHIYGKDGTRLASSGDGRTWVVSLITGSGTAQFVEGLANALKTQYAFLLQCYASTLIAFLPDLIFVLKET